MSGKEYIWLGHVNREVQAPPGQLGGAFHCHNWQMRYLPFLLLLVTFPVAAETVHYGKVIKIADGDTLTLLVDNTQHKIRLSISTPQNENSLSAPGQSRRCPIWPLAKRPA